MGLLSYLQQTDKPQLQYVKPRADNRQLLIDHKYIGERKKITEEQVAAVIRYAESFICRNKTLLEYFGEAVSSKCGVCDVCLEEKRRDSNAFLAENIINEIFQLLSAGHLSLDELVTGLHYGTEKERINMVRELLDSGQIKTDGRKYYV